ncbi:hypothetical protein DP62_483 [Burkholderia pseudomallei]|uniref:hypothetical protein n=1 Tax=Burkholderia pseudomallei TaxID=28450 RepID=UPI00050F2847|nr:hypothetical protein [Burkholderia pseudomallei]KGC90706.1 hypothetical protein DP62_483 [Burkholderia pseudomallei]
MKESGRSLTPGKPMSPGEQWDAIHDRILAELPRLQVSASCAGDDDGIDSPIPVQSASLTKKKDAIDFLLYMLDPPVRLETSKDEQTYQGGRQTLRLADSQHDIPNGWDSDLALDQALRRYRRRLEADPSYDYRTPSPESAAYPFLPEARFRHLIREVFKKLEAPYKVGASLYIYHQMQLLGKSPAPSLSKSQSLVDNAPLHQDQTASHERRGDSRKIGENWGKYFGASHYWAAFVVMSGNPFIPPEDALPRFLLQADIDKFKRLAAAFLHFRRVLSDNAPHDAARSQQHIFRALYTDLTRSDFGDMLPLPASEIPNLIADFQWQWLDQYSSGKQAPALRRPRKGSPPDNELGW